MQHCDKRIHIHPQFKIHRSTTPPQLNTLINTHATSHRRRGFVTIRHHVHSNVLQLVVSMSLHHCHRDTFSVHSLHLTPLSISHMPYVSAHVIHVPGTSVFRLSAVRATSDDPMYSAHIPDKRLLRFSKGHLPHPVSQC